MLKSAHVVTGALAIAVFATALAAPAAMAAGTNCLNKANKYVACTDRLKTKTGQKANQTGTFRTMPLWGFRARPRI